MSEEQPRTDIHGSRGGGRNLTQAVINRPTDNAGSEDGGYGVEILKGTRS